MTESNRTSRKSRIKAISLLKSNNVRASSKLVNDIAIALDEAFQDGLDSAAAYSFLDTIVKRSKTE